MINNQIPKINQVPINYIPPTYMLNDALHLNPAQNQLPLALSMNQVMSNPLNSQYPLFYFLFPDQFLCQNQPYFLPRFYLSQQQAQLNALNQLMIYQKILNENKINDAMIEQKQSDLNKENIHENKCYNDGCDLTADREKKESFNNNLNQSQKKFLIFHEKDNLDKNNIILNFNDEKNKISENNNIDFNSLNNNKEVNKNINIIKINEKNNEIKENKGKLSLFTISNINTNVNNEMNNNLLNKNKQIIPIIKTENNSSQNNNESNNNQIKNKDDIHKNLDNKLNYEVNSKELFNNYQADIKNDKTKYYRCSFKDCNKVFLKQSNLKDHIRTHTGEKPYICSHPGCGKTFSQHGNLKKHEKIHLGNKKYYCSFPNCGKKFSASYNLKIHYRCHTGEKPYKCNFPNCGRSFYDKGNLKYHEKNMHALENMEFPFSCEHMGCNAKFRTKLEKLQHHSEMEIDCFVERKELIKLIQRYKIFFRKLTQKKNIDIEKNEIVLNLKKNYEEIQNKLIDQKIFTYYLGEDFDNECTNIEEIENIAEQNEQDINNMIENENNDKIVIANGNENEDENGKNEKKKEKDNNLKENETINNQNEFININNNENGNIFNEKKE